ncbi:MAG: hypothetical protein HOO06_08100 [Bdellovibrionaceae bacterium]|jgi:hypothetical protein|nr:hypothetical protein [Pseudobdellovibrionaceae bacterium]
MIKLFIGLLFFLQLPNLYSANEVISADKISYVKDIQPIFNKRCVQCHGCYNAPCQLKLTSYKGFNRGLNSKHILYNASRVFQGFFTDPALTRPAYEYKSIGFTPVYDKHARGNDALMGSYIWQLLNLRQTNNSYVFKASEEAKSCPSDIEELQAHINSNQNMGMPFGLPALEEDSEEYKVLKKWIMAGSKGPTDDEYKQLNWVPAPVKEKINQWESFLNIRTLKRQLVSRYIFEHLFLAHTYFEKPEKNQTPGFYRLVRSTTQCKNGINELITRRPWDNKEQRVRKEEVVENQWGDVAKIPVHHYGDTFKEDQIFYCFKKYTESITHKNHLTYDMSGEKLDRIQTLFADSKVENIKKLPKRTDKVASNPFIVFKAISAKSRYQFLLDNANYHIRTFIRGPVCKGSQALNSIDDRFWAFFLKPDADPMVTDPKFYDLAKDNLMLPAYSGSGYILFTYFLNAMKLNDRNTDYRELRRNMVKNYYSPKDKSGALLNIDQLWTGEDSFSTNGEHYMNNKNNQARQTIFRHEDSASATIGLIGPPSKTIFVIDYSILERLYYSLVAGYDVFGSAKHQLLSRVYMTYLKEEAEDNFLSFLPSAEQYEISKYWYRDPKKHRNDSTKVKQQKFAIAKPYLERKNQLAIQMQKKVLDNLNSNKSLDTAYNSLSESESFLNQKFEAWDNRKINNQKDFYEALKSISLRKKINTAYVEFFPSVTLVLLKTKKQNHLYSIMKTNAHYKVDNQFSSILNEKYYRDYDNDHLIVSDQVIGSYPNYIIELDINQANDFISDLHEHSTEKRIKGETEEKAIARRATDRMKFKRFFGRFGAPYEKPNDLELTDEKLAESYDKFWSTYDALDAQFKAQDPIEYGILDLIRYEAND